MVDSIKKKRTSSSDEWALQKVINITCPVAVNTYGRYVTGNHGFVGGSET